MKPYKSKFKKQFWKATKLLSVPISLFTPNENKQVFLLEDNIGRILQLTFDISSIDMATFNQVKFQIYVDDKLHTDIFIYDLIHGLGYDTSNTEQLFMTLYYILAAKIAKLSISLYMDFFDKLEIRIINGNGNSDIGMWMLYHINYYAENDKWNE